MWRAVSSRRRQSIARLIAFERAPVRCNSIRSSCSLESHPCCCSDHPPEQRSARDQEGSSLAVWLTGRLAGRRRGNNNSLGAPKQRSPAWRPKWAQRFGCSFLRSISPQAKQAKLCSFSIVRQTRARQVQQRLPGTTINEAIKLFNWRLGQLPCLALASLAPPPTTTTIMSLLLACPLSVAP